MGIEILQQHFLGVSPKIALVRHHCLAGGYVDMAGGRSKDCSSIVSTGQSSAIRNTGIRS
jgi:hypothetical protein